MFRFSQPLPAQQESKEKALSKLSLDDLVQFIFKINNPDHLLGIKVLLDRHGEKESIQQQNIFNILLMKLKIQPTFSLFKNAKDKKSWMEKLLACIQDPASSRRHKLLCILVLNHAFLGSSACVTAKNLAQSFLSVDLTDPLDKEILLTMITEFSALEISVLFKKLLQHYFPGSFHLLINLSASFTHDQTRTMIAFLIHEAIHSLEKSVEAINALLMLNPAPFIKREMPKLLAGLQDIAIHPLSRLKLTEFLGNIVHDDQQLTWTMNQLLDALILRNESYSIICHALAALAPQYLPHHLEIILPVLIEQWNNSNHPIRTESYEVCNTLARTSKYHHVIFKQLMPLVDHFNVSIRVQTTHMLGILFSQHHAGNQVYITLLTKAFADLSRLVQIKACEGLEKSNFKYTEEQTQDLSKTLIKKLDGDLYDFDVISAALKTLISFSYTESQFDRVMNAILHAAYREWIAIDEACEAINILLMNHRDFVSPFKDTILNLMSFLMEDERQWVQDANIKTSAIVHFLTLPPSASSKILIGYLQMPNKESDLYVLACQLLGELSYESCTKNDVEEVVAILSQCAQNENADIVEAAKKSLAYLFLNYPEFLLDKKADLMVEALKEESIFKLQLQSLPDLDHASLQKVIADFSGDMPEDITLNFCARIIEKTKQEIEAGLFNAPNSLTLTLSRN